MFDRVHPPDSRPERPAVFRHTPLATALGAGLFAVVFPVAWLAAGPLVSGFTAPTPWRLAVALSAAVAVSSVARLVDETRAERALPAVTVAVAVLGVASAGVACFWP